MRTRIIRWIIAFLLLVVPAAALPTAALAQNEVIPRSFTGPLSHPRYEDGGWYTGFEFMYFKQRNTIGAQDLAFRGFVDVNGSITGTPGSFVGSGATALSTNQLSGPETFAPGFNLSLGYRFADGIAIQANWWHMADVRLNAAASVIAPNYLNGGNLENTVLFSPVFNVPPQFAGNERNLDAGTKGATFGIWNAASIEQINFIQRFDMVDFNVRVPVTQDPECNYRTFANIGPRGIVMWERFKWRTVDVSAVDPTLVGPGGGNGIGVAGGNTIADYNNVVSNRLYGFYVGCGNELRLPDVRFGEQPIGTFSLYFDVNAGIYADFVKGRARYELEDRTIAYTYARNLFDICPGFDAHIGFQWYIYEAITIRLGYDYMGLFNTVASPQPVDFNLGSAHPRYVNGQYRPFDGLRFGVGLVW